MIQPKQRKVIFSKTKDVPTLLQCYCLIYERLLCGLVSVVHSYICLASREK